MLHVRRTLFSIQKMEHFFVTCYDTMCKVLCIICKYYRNFVVPLPDKQVNYFRGRTAFQNLALKYVCYSRSL